MVTPSRDMPLLRQQVASVRQEIRNLVMMVMKPGLPLAQVKLIHELERSCRAELKLRLKALEHAENYPEFEPRDDGPSEILARGGLLRR